MSCTGGLEVGLKLMVTSLAATPPLYYYYSRRTGIQLSLECMQVNKHKAPSTSLLERHFNTIGIGEVFVSGPPDHPLPSQYLSPTNDSEKPMFRSREITGTIKASAEDFVVREIAPIERIRKVYNDKTEEELQQLCVAGITHRELDLQEDRPGRSHALVESTKAPKEQNNLIEQRVRTPRKSLQEILSACSCSETVETILGKLKRLDENALASSNQQQPQADLDPITIQALLDTKGCRLDRRGLHIAVRDEFPLLKSEAVREEGTSEFLSDKKQQSPITISIDERFLGCVSFLHDPLVALRELYQFYKRGAEASLQGGQQRVWLCLREGLPRSERRTIHHTIQEKSNRQLTTSTTKPDEDSTTSIIVEWSKMAVKRCTNKKRKRSEGKNDSNDVILFVLKKTGVEQLTALKLLAKGFRCGQSDIDTAGIKDMCAVTYQFCTVNRHVSSRQMEQSRAALEKQHIEFRILRRVSWRLQKGELQGNRFDITIRDIKRLSVSGSVESFELVEAEHLESSVERIRTHGFVNFFGQQRVGIPGSPGVVGVRAFDIGRAMLQGNFLEAINLLMTGRKITRGNETERDDAKNFRHCWVRSKGNIEEAWKAIPKGHLLAREKAVLLGLKRYGGGADNAVAAFRCLHYSQRIYYVNAYQSLVWNQMATKRLEQFGSRVVEGDLVQLGDGRDIHIVTAEDVSTWGISDVVLPLPGLGVQYPKNCIGQNYQELLDRDNIVFKKNGPEECASRGSYRKLVCKCSNVNLSIVSRGAGGSARDVKLSFDLPRGSFATMVLRELMTSTVDREYTIDT